MRFARLTRRPRTVEEAWHTRTDHGWSTPKRSAGTDTSTLTTGCSALSDQPIRTADELREFEDSRVQLRALELKANPIEGDFGLEHLKEIHRRPYLDAYPWAGEVRTVGIKEGESGFLPPEHAGFVVDGAARLMREDGMLRPGMDTEAWADKLADRFNDVNEAHPFREGNGRTQRLYFDQVAEAGGKTIHWNVLTKEQNAAVSGAARDGQIAPLRDALRTMVTDRMDPLALQRAKQAAETMRASSATRTGRPQARGAGGGERAYYGRDGHTNGTGTAGPRRDGYGH